MDIKRIWRKCIPPVILLVFGLVGGAILDRQVLALFLFQDKVVPADMLDYQLIGEAWDKIRKHYVDQKAVKSKALTYGAISGMVDALGDTGHSNFLTPEMLKQQNDFAQGQFKGIGAQVQMKGGQVVIVAPLDNSPAQKAGLRPADVIMKVDGQDITGLPLEQVVRRISGTPGTSVTLTIFTPQTGHTRSVKLVRASIVVHNATWQVLPGTAVGHLRLSAFSHNVTKDLKQILMDMKAKKLKGIILDLRNNPGGLLEEAIGVSSQFLSEGIVLKEKNARGEINSEAVLPGGLAPNIPMVALINSGTASAAEIVAGALHDAHRATLIGEVTFGTGTVLTDFVLSDGSALLLAVEEWLTPNGSTIWHKGITPDIIVSLPPDVLPLSPETERGMAASQLQASKDEQLLRALDLLAQPAARSSLQ